MLDETADRVNNTGASALPAQQEENSSMKAPAQTEYKRSRLALLRLTLFVVVCYLVATASAVTRYVDLNNPTPAAPYTSWATASTNIQNAIDVAAIGDLILVTNGVYQTGVRTVSGSRNRVAITKQCTVQSVNGPTVTSIVGFQVPGTTNGATAVRCVYLSPGALLVGFTLTNGATQTSGDIYTLQSGGGVFSSSGIVSNCVLIGNAASRVGGGAYSAILKNCNLSRNFAYSGGGASHANLNNCTLSGNRASTRGGGAADCGLNNCLLMANFAPGGGGASGGYLTNCTVTGNSALSGGGTDYGLLYNCLNYYNSALNAPNYKDGNFNYCSTIPFPPRGIGNRTTEPQLANAFRLSAGSPCRAAGNAAFASGTDIDGELWAGSPAIGCDEYWSGSLTGVLNVAISVLYTNVATGFALDFQTVIDGRVGASAWNFGDGVVVSNRPWASHAWLEAGDYTAELRAYNESYPAGVAASVVVHVEAQPVHYVSLSSSNPVAPYRSWATAAPTIQEAVNAATLPGALVLVSDGVYQSGGCPVYGVSNRVAVIKPINVQSVNGPAATYIVGDKPWGLRCVYLTNGAALAGFTLTNGTTPVNGDAVKAQSGGGAWCESSSAIISNCVLVNNIASKDGGATHAGTIIGCILMDNLAAGNGGGAVSATLNNCTLTGNRAQNGGGALGATLNNCTLTDNFAELDGGAINGCTLNNCTITGNSAGRDGGGVYGGVLNNCVVFYNTAVNAGNYYSGTFNYCCTTPLPEFGGGNRSANPELASKSHLSAGSPCRAAGNNAFASGTDIDGEPWAGSPAIGCDEYWSGSLAGVVNVAIRVLYTNVATGFALDFEEVIDGRVGASAWNFGDGAVVSNRPWASHAWLEAGDYTVELRAYNESYPAGVAASVVVHVEAQPVHYVSASSSNPVAPYTSWATAALTIQDAVNAATLPGGLVLVNDGIYQTGGWTSYGVNTRVAVIKPLNVQSVNGPTLTHIVGYQVPGTTNGPSAVRWCI